MMNLHSSSIPTDEKNEIADASIIISLCELKMASLSNLLFEKEEDIISRNAILTPTPSGKIISSFYIISATECITL